MPNYTPNYNLKKPLPTENYNIDDPNGNMDLLDAALKGLESLTGTITTDNTGWTQASYGADYQYRKQIAIAGVTNADFPSIAFNLATKEIASDAGMSHVESYNGGIYLYAESLPTADVTFDYDIERG